MPSKTFFPRVETHFLASGNNDAFIEKNQNIYTAKNRIVHLESSCLPVEINVSARETYISACKNCFCHYWKHVFQLVETLIVVAIGLLVFLLQETGRFWSNETTSGNILPLVETLIVSLGWRFCCLKYSLLHLETDYPVAERYFSVKVLFLGSGAIIPNSGNTLIYL